MKSRASGCAGASSCFGLAGSRCTQATTSSEWGFGSTPHSATKGSFDGLPFSRSATIQPLIKRCDSAASFNCGSFSTAVGPATWWKRLATDHGCIASTWCSVSAPGLRIVGTRGSAACQNSRNHCSTCSSSRSSAEFGAGW